MGLYDVANSTVGNATDLDQIVDALSGNNDVGQIVAYQQIAVPGAPTVAVDAVSGNLTGNYQYAVAFGTGYWQGPTGTGTLHAQGNTGGGTASAVVSPNAQQVSLSAIPTGPVGVVQRFIYRTKANGTAYFLLTVLSDNTTTSFTDNISDANLGAAMPTTNSTGTLYKLWNATADTITVQTINATSQSEPLVLPNLSAFPPIGPSGAFIIVQSGTYVSNGTSWVNPMVNLMMFSTAHGGTADFYGPTTIHGGVGLTVNALPIPSGLTAANATSGAVGANIVANTTYTYELTAVSYNNTETNASASVSITTGATAYPINLTWTNGGADVQFYNVYKGGNFLAQVAGSASSYQDTGNTATTSRVPPAANQTGLAQLNGGALIPSGASLTASGTGVINATQLGGQPATNYLRTDSGAPNPQTVANPVAYNATVSLNQGFTAANPAEIYTFLDGNTASTSVAGQRYYWARLPATDGNKTDYALYVYDGTNFYSPFAFSYQNKKVALARDGGGWTSSLGQVGSVGGQTTAGSLGVAAVVAQAQGVHVTATTQQTILSFTPSVTGLYEVKINVTVNNGVNGNDCTTSVVYQNTSVGTTVTMYPLFTYGNAVGTQQMNGATSVGNNAFCGSSFLVQGTAGDAISVYYTDPTNTPNDYVSAVITRLA